MWGLMRTNVRPDNGEKQRARRRQRGQSLVETAIVFPILVLLLAIVIDASRAFETYIVLTNAAREGARFASLANPLTEEKIRELVYENVVGSGSNITDMSQFQKDDIVLEASSTVVTVTVPYTVDLWFGGILGLNEWPLQKTAIMPRAEP
jgi:Flp pilus assembly protein TadG